MVIKAKKSHSLLSRLENQESQWWNSVQIQRPENPGAECVESASSPKVENQEH